MEPDGTDSTTVVLAHIQNLAANYSGSPSNSGISYPVSAKLNILSDEDLNASGQNSLNLVFMRFIPAKRDMRPFHNLLGKAKCFCKALEVLQASALGTSLASVKHWPSPRDITCLIALLVGIYLIHIIW